MKGDFVKEITANLQNTQLKDVVGINEILNKIKERNNWSTGKLIGQEERVGLM